MTDIRKNYLITSFLCPNERRVPRNDKTLAIYTDDLPGVFFPGPAGGLRYEVGDLEWLFIKGEWQHERQQVQLRDRKL